MLKTKFIALTALAAFIMVPAVASAGENNAKVSYSAKKQGRVVFQKTTPDETVSAQDTMDEMNPADVEPAAGAYEPEEAEKRDDLAKSMKLPRK